MQRREFITLLGSATVAWPLAVRAQQPERMRRIGVLMSVAADDPEGQARLTAFLQGLQQLGWADGRNVRIDIRWGAGDADRYRRYAAELVALAPDVILAASSSALEPLQQATRTVPIVFVTIADPVGAGFINSLARPGGNATGFSQFEYGVIGKWLELLKEIAPGVTRVAVIRDPTISAGAGQFGAIQTAGPLGTIHRELIVTLAARHKLPAVYYERYFVIGGGLISYGPHLIDQYQHAAGYVDRILKGEKPADLPVQAPTKQEL